MCSQTVISILSMLAVLVPAGFNVVSDSNSGLILCVQLIFMLWTINIGDANSTPSDTFQDATPIPDTTIPNPLMFVVNLPMTFFRIVFVYQMYRCYQSRTTIKRTMFVGP